MSSANRSWAKGSNFFNFSFCMQGAFHGHYHEISYPLAYIDKMWDIPFKRNFPIQIKL